MNGKLTDKQRRVADYVMSYWSVEGQMPTRAEVGRAMGITATAAHYQLVALERKGVVRRNPNRWRGIELLPAAQLHFGRVYRLPVIGTIAAGQPIEALQDPSDFFPVAAELARGEDNYILRVRGNSMVGDGIHSGDYVIVQPQSSAQDGDTVVALLEDNTATLKRFYREPDCIRLEPANPRHKPLRVRQVTVQGKVVAVLRQFD